jgi:hypothetical protein
MENPEVERPVVLAQDDRTEPAGAIWRSVRTPVWKRATHENPGTWHDSRPRGTRLTEPSMTKTDPGVIRDRSWARHTRPATEDRSANDLAEAD